MEEVRKEFNANYEITETLSQPSNATLYKAVEKSTNNAVLIKVYFPTLTWSDEVINEFFNRLSYLQFIEHDNLMPILDMGKYQDAPYVVYPFVSKEFFTGYKFHRSTEAETLDFFGEIAGVLEFLHKQEILHGALCPESIIIDAAGHPRLYDHGLHDILKKLLLENVEESFGNLSISSVNSTSPEQILGRSATRQSDIYSFGTLLLLAFFGEYPFEGNLAPEIALWHLNRGVSQIPVTRKISRNALRFIQKCIQVDSEQRFAGFAEVLRVIDRTRMGRRSGFSYKTRLKLLRYAQPQRNRLWWGGLPLVLLASIAWLYLQSSPAATAPTELPAVQGPTDMPVPLPTVAATYTAVAPTEEQILTETVSGPLPAYRPAIEGETPQVLSEKIAVANVNSIIEVSRLGYGKPEHADISSSGRYAAVASSAGVYIANATSPETWIDTQEWATAVQFSADEKILAIGVRSGDIQLWDWKNGVLLHTLKGHSGQITRIVYSSNGRFLYSASYDQHVIVWNLASHEVDVKLPVHSEPVNDIVVTSDGRTLATCSDDHLVRVWDLANQTKTYELRYNGKLQALALSSDDVYLAIGDDAGYIQQINIRTRQLRTDPIPVRSRVWSLQYIENDNKLLAGIDDGVSRVYDASQMRYGGISALFEIPPAPLPLVKIFGFDFVFNSFAASSGKESSVLTLRWDGQVNFNNNTIIEPFFDSKDLLDFSDDGTVLAAGGKRLITVVWNTQNNGILLRNHIRLPKGDPISPDGKYLVLSADGMYRLVNLSNDASSRDLSVGIQDGVLSYARQGAVLVAANLRESRVWDYNSGYETEFESFPENGCFVTLSPNNGEVLQINTAAGAIPIWNDETKPFCAKSFLYTNSISAVSSDMSLYAYRNSSGLVEGFSLKTNQLLWRYPENDKPASKLLAVAVSSDGSLVVLGSEDGSLLFLDGSNGKPLTEFTGNFGAVQAIKFSNNGSMIATAGSDGTVRVFGVIK